MHWHSCEPQAWPPHAAVVVLEGEPGAARDGVVERWLAQRDDRTGPTWHLRCRQQDGGVWAGLSTLVEDLVGDLRERAPDLLSRHGQELCLVVASLQSELTFPQSLTDTIAEEERTRNYAADHAYRSLHGLIDLVGEWHELADPGPVWIAVDGYNDASALVRRFFTELVRRRGAQLDLHLLAVADPGCGDDVAGAFDPSAVAVAVALDLPREHTAVPAPEAMTREAIELEQRLPQDPTAREAQLPRLIETWRRSETPGRALKWQLEEMERCNRAGLYEASLPYAGEVEAALDRLHAEDRERYLAALTVLYACYVPLAKPEAARAILERALTREDDAAVVARLCYRLSMLHARYLKPADLAKAEELLHRALRVLEEADLPAEKRHFLSVFTMNGLAFIRVRQGRAPEAVELCTAGVARLAEHLEAGHHLLHRSVLLYNIAQVYASTGPYGDAVAYFSKAMEMDPNYSEYYNDRGTVYLKMDRLQDAERDYLRAIELSPPYPEVWTNLGQCYRMMDRMDEAVRAYSRALDLDATCTLAVVGRADAQLALDHRELALDDYDRALAMAPEQPLVLSSRAILHYEAGRLPAAVADLDEALRLAPELAELYQNRAVALQELGRRGEAVDDLSTYLKLSPDAEDRHEVEDSLAVLAG